MNVISYNDYEVSSKINKILAPIFYKYMELVVNLDDHAKLTRKIAKLSDLYSKYKEHYEFPPQFKSKYVLQSIISPLLGLT